MRTITKNELPQDFSKLTLIKSSERARYRRMANALESTLKRCSEIHEEYESHTIKLRENCEKEGFSTGFYLFFSQLLTMLDQYEKQQNSRMITMREHLVTALKSSLHDPVIVERIIHHLQEKCGHQKDLKIVIPKIIPLPDDVDTSHYQFTDDNHITVQNETEAIRFPSESLCWEWIHYADDEIDSLNKKINGIIPDTLSSIAAQLTLLCQKENSTKIIEEKEK
ncbi:type III secretion protein [Pectobacterium brasiliense]|uniref:type III secretion protein n=1 Tax=Pectobacterium brasiliense TaxID=180957 RepID=UPI00196968C1|nr:type III secretion protein [Pectobacterium brasiliense]MBN3264695.1 type III secretion protein [Pectobacterium brasiliense]